MATDEQIATAFNAGYTMQKVDPASVDKLLSTNSDNEIVQAMKNGAKQSQKEKIADQQREINERNKTKTRSR